FPNTDPAYRGISSLELLRRVLVLVQEKGGRLLNIDASLIAEAPKVGPYVPEMRERLGAALGLPPARVGVKATTNERMGFVGRGEGIAALAVATVLMPEVSVDS
ncbi:MAG: 2-C-methyl-D-erythritol 2,4-cyclodiphosphate synthase, partial [Chthoniobacterales bacterium]|nr:2-C-methyl-D-erythritol 2,4-cyclodiphosphate synthase [Chthoniobacterales bacterium]